MTNKNNVSIGNCGEYFVAAELERRGFTVAIPMSDVKDFDILAINRESNKQIAIQVKTTSSKQKKWVLSYKNENIIDNNIYYVFATLNDLNVPEYHIVPSAIVAEAIKNGHSNWLNSLNRNGKEHNDNPIRVFSDNDNIYLDKWELLK